MAKTITTLNSLLDTRRLLRSIRLTTDKYNRDLNKTEQNWNRTTNRTMNKRNNDVRVFSEKVYRDSNSHIKVLQYISIILKTHLYEPTNLNKKMQSQTAALLAENQKLEKIAESIMEAFITSTQPDTVLNTIVSDLKKKFSRELNVTSKIITQREQPYGILTLKSPHSSDCLYCVIYSDDEEGNKYKTFINELPTEINNKNFSTFLSPGQAFREVLEILYQDGILRL